MTDDGDALKRDGREFGFWLQALGTLASSIAAISFVQHVFDVGLVSIFGDLVGFYRALLYPVYDVASRLCGLHIPAWYREISVLSFLSSATFLRAIFLSVPQEKYQDDVKLVKSMMIVVYLFVALSLWGLAIPFTIWFVDDGMGKPKDTDDPFSAALKKVRYLLPGLYFRSLKVIAGACVAFFVLNASFA